MEIIGGIGKIVPLSPFPPKQRQTQQSFNKCECRSGREREGIISVVMRQQWVGTSLTRELAFFFYLIQIWLLHKVSNSFAEPAARGGRNNKSQRMFFLNKN